MEDVDLAHAKEHLEELIARAVRGQDVHIVDARLGKVRLTTIEPSAIGKRRSPRVPGFLKGKVPPPPEDFFDPLSEEELKLWYGDNA